MQNEFFYILPNLQLRRKYILLRNGMYLVKRPIIDVKVGEHYGVMVCGKTLKKIGLPETCAIIIHKTDKGISWSYMSDEWYFVNGVPLNQLNDAISRINISLTTPNYHLIFSNCEHFARFVTEGIVQSTQVQTVGVLGGLAFLAYILSRDNNRKSYNGRNRN